MIPEMTEIAHSRPGSRPGSRQSRALPAGRLTKDYVRVRGITESLCRPLAIEDYGVQSGDDVSPPKWHLAHTAWFFETFVLAPFAGGYREFNPHYVRLFNSYYETVGELHPRTKRGQLSRPTVDEVYRYRAYVDAAMAELLANPNHADRTEIERRAILGLHHEQQHQELILTDILHNFAANPLRPVYRQTPPPPAIALAEPEWISFPGGIKQIGHDRKADASDNGGFAFDNEGQQHRVFVGDFKLAARPASNGDFIDFIDAGGYRNPDYWLSDGLQTARAHGWLAPLYWEKIDGAWHQMTLGGMRPVELSAPVSHVSFFEASAYARFRNCRLPTEAEWEVAASCVVPKNSEITGNFADSGLLQPAGVAGDDGLALRQMFGDVWEWTASAYQPYPGYIRDHGALGEYNGKFMSGQMVLRGGSCVTPNNHIRETYRNFFYPRDRWQFTGIRLAADRQC
jgi:ergothioneine biosynthesis protein EgtB